MVEEKREIWKEGGIIEKIGEENRKTNEKVKKKSMRDYKNRMCRRKER